MTNRNLSSSNAKGSKKKQKFSCKEDSPSRALQKLCAEKIHSMNKTTKTLLKESSCQVVPCDKRTEAGKLTDAALHFAYAALWPEEKFREKEIQSIKRIIAYYLPDDSFLRHSFKIFIEAIVLYKKHFPGEPVLHPLVWLNQGYSGGIAKALKCYQDVQEIRKDVPLYENAASVFANLMLKYSKIPTSSIVKRCRSSLLRLKDRSLLKLFYFHIIHANHIN